MRKAPPLKLKTVPVGSEIGLLEPFPPLGSPLNAAAWNATFSLGFTRRRIPGAGNGYAGPEAGRLAARKVGQLMPLFMKLDAVSLWTNWLSASIKPVRTDQRSSGALCSYQSA